MSMQVKYLDHGLNNVIIIYQLCSWKLQYWNIKAVVRPYLHVDRWNEILSRFFQWQCLKYTFLSSGTLVKCGPLLSLWGPQCYMAAPGGVSFDTECFSQSIRRSNQRPHIRTVAYTATNMNVGPSFKNRLSNHGLWTLCSNGAAASYMFEDSGTCVPVWFNLFRSPGTLTEHIRGPRDGALVRSVLL